MKNQSDEIKASRQVQKPVQEVFEAIIDPAKMSNYFISKSSGRMEQDKKLAWQQSNFGRDKLLTEK